MTLTSIFSTNVISEAAAIIRARSFVRSCGIDSVPVDLSRYLVPANAEMRESARLGPKEAGNTMYVQGRHLITVNANDRVKRRRFTLLHEIAHIVLDLPSKHSESITDDALYSYVRRPPEEVICDTFAAECLLPHEFISRDLKNAVAGFPFIDEVANKYDASLSCAASRVTINAPFACAYVLSQDGYVRFVTCSQTMREARFWVPPGIAVPAASITGQHLKAPSTNAAGVVPANVWTSSDECMDVDVSEEVRILRAWNQALTLIWFSEGDISTHQRADQMRDSDDEEPLLRELDGKLSWPGRSRRK